jgi:2-C-methyl-D-erythritol 4-phosphate cytidylyltransferase
MNAAVIICAAGSSTRFGGKQKKIFEKVGDTAVFLRSINVFTEIEDVRQIILAIAAEDEEKIRLNWEANLAFNGVELCYGGKERFQTVSNALAKVREDIDIVAIHDAARCCVKREDILRAFDKCSQTKAAILAAPVVSTLKKADGGIIEATIDRASLYEAQTPQVFNRRLLISAYDKAIETQADPKDITDDCIAIEKLPHPISIIETDNSNIKITNKIDIAIAEAIIKSRDSKKPKQFHPFAAENDFRDF